MTLVAEGKRAGERTKKRFRADLLGLALGVTLTIVAWGYLVIAAIDFGAEGRHDGDGRAWLLLAVAAAGAMLCLFLAFLLAARFTRALGITHAPEPKQKRDPNAPRGGKRAAR